METATMVVDAKKALEVIRPIPAEKFITDRYRNDNKSCVLGWIHRVVGGDDGSAYGDDNGYGLRQASRRFLREIHGLEYDDIAGVNNDNDINGYTEPEIKDRVVHLLEDMEKAGF